MTERTGSESRLVRRILSRFGS